MPVFRASRSGRSVVIEAPTVMEATARAVLLHGLRRDSSLIVEPLAEVEASRGPSEALIGSTPVDTQALERTQQHTRARRADRQGSRERTASVPQLLIALVALSALLVAVLVGGGWAIVARATHTGPLGDCLRIGLCTGTPLSTVEARTGFDLPEGAERLRSSASRDGRFVSALVRLPAGSELPTAPVDAVPALTVRAADALRSVGATDLSGWEDGAVGVFTGRSPDHTVVFLRFDDAVAGTR